MEQVAGAGTLTQVPSWAASAGIVCTSAPCCAQHVDSRVHDVGAVGGKRRNGDPRASKRLLVEELSIVAEAVARQEARRRRWIVGVLPCQNSEQDRGVRHGPRDGARRILVGRDRDDAVAAHEPDGGLDADDAVRARRAENRS